MTSKPRQSWAAYSRVLDMHLSGMTLRDIGNECGVSYQRIQQMVRIAKQQLAYRVFFGCPPGRKNIAIKSRILRRVERKKRERKKRESRILKKLEHLLLEQGLSTIRDQAKALNLSPSTAHHLFSGDWKIGVRYSTISRILKSRHLPKQARKLLVTEFPADPRKLTPGAEDARPYYERQKRHYERFAGTHGKTVTTAVPHQRFCSVRCKRRMQERRRRAPKAPVSLNCLDGQLRTASRHVAAIQEDLHMRRARGPY